MSSISNRCGNGCSHSIPSMYRTLAVSPSHSRTSPSYQAQPPITSGSEKQLITLAPFAISSSKDSAGNRNFSPSSSNENFPVIGLETQRGYFIVSSHEDFPSPLSNLSTFTRRPSDQHILFSYPVVRTIARLPSTNFFWASTSFLQTSSYFLISLRNRAAWPFFTPSSTTDAVHFSSDESIPIKEVKLRLCFSNTSLYESIFSLLSTAFKFGISEEGS
mmetsp:Transcript_24665/g.34462  ORF Transcript_24665/g.34462 Transcript_24665/m.34462 type:complete len:218 (-) Transcript_24665:193-846(-)